MTNSARQLATATKNDDVSGVRRWASKISDLNSSRLTGGLYPLSFAVERGKPACFLALLEAGADPNVRNRDGTAAIHLSAAADSPLFLEYALTHGANPDLRVEGRKSCEFPLSFAIYSGRIENAVLLMKHGADVNAVDSYGRNMLLQAWEAAEFEIVYRLLQHGADYNAPGKRDFTFMEHVRYASPGFWQNQPGNQEQWCNAVLEFLLDRGVNPTQAIWTGDKWKF